MVGQPVCSLLKARDTPDGWDRGEERAVLRLSVRVGPGRRESCAPWTSTRGRAWPGAITAEASTAGAGEAGVTVSTGRARQGVSGGRGGGRRAHPTAAAELMGGFSDGARACTYLVAEGRGEAIRVRGGECDGQSNMCVRGRKRLGRTSPSGRMGPERTGGVRAVDLLSGGGVGQRGPPDSCSSAVPHGSFYGE